MSDRRQEFRVGVVALATAVITVLLVSINTGASLNFGVSPSTIQIRVDRAPGVGPNTPIRKDGVLIGRVVSTSFLPEGGVLVTANLDRGAPIYETDECRIRPSSLFGDAVISFAYTGVAGQPVPIEPGAMVDGAALPDPIEALTSLQVDVAPTIDSIGEAADSITELTTRVNRALGDDFGGDQMNSLLDQAILALDQFSLTMQEMSRTMNNFDRMINDPQLQQAITQTANEAPQLLSDARATVQKATETLDSFGGVVTSAETNLRNLEGLTAPLGERGPELAGSLIAAVESLEGTLAELGMFATALSSSEGTVSKLLNDPLLYDNISIVVGNANSVIMRLDELLKRARPIVEDTRVITDKLAREPGRVISGAFNRGPGIK